MCYPFIDVISLYDKSSLIIFMKTIIEKNFFKYIMALINKVALNMFGYKKKKIKKGAEKVPKIDLIIDLHGWTENQSFKILQAYIEKSYKNNWKNILIITGKSGSLRVNVPRWLEYNKDIFYNVVCIKNAPIHLGGDGAFIIKLKSNC